MLETVNVIIRLHTLAGLRRLSNALFSVFAQDYPDVQPIVVLQSFSPADVTAVEEKATEFGWNESKCSPLVLNVETPPGDYRSKLLNEGLKICEGRYLAFLDFDDVLYRHAYTYLVRRLHRTGATISFARVYRKEI